MMSSKSYLPREKSRLNSSLLQIYQVRYLCAYRLTRLKRVFEDKDITFLDGKRSQNCNIMLKAIKMDAKLIKKAINDVDTETLPRHILGELLKFIPTDEELNALKAVDAADIKNLAFAEYFMYEISEIDKYGDKLAALYFKTSYGEYEDDADALIAWLQSASDDVMNSKKFKEILKIILALGNYMNAGQRGGAYGFKLNSILKMMDTKSSVVGRKHTLLHHLVDLIDKKFPKVRGFQNELKSTEDGAKGMTVARISFFKTI